jgi:hypothetical protein
MSPLRAYLIRALILPLSALAAGCVQLSSSSSIRVDVEVYKGPLSREPSVQMAELMALWREFDVSLNGYVAAVCGAYVEAIENEVLKRVSSEPANLVRNAFVSCHQGAVANPAPPSAQQTTPVASIMEPKSMAPHKPKLAEPAAARLITPQQCAGYQKTAKLSMIESESCFYLAQVYADALDLRGRIAGLSKYETQYSQLGVSGTPRGFEDGKKLSPQTQAFLNDVASLAMHMKFKAYYWALGQVSFPVYDRMTRAVVNNFTTLNSEYANQLGARADALLRQGRPDKPSSAALLAQSIYLRDSQPTDFLNLYTWNRAVYPALIEDMVWHPFESLSAEETSTRVRAFERLYGDHYWSRINTVNANGDGEVRMALIKDEIGNWNLKSFDSDPTKLLQAYSSGAVSLINKAVSTATTGGSAASANGLLALASHMAFPGGPQAPGGTNAPAGDPVGVLNRNAVQRMNKAYADGDTRVRDAAKAETAAMESAQRKLESAEKEPTKESCIEADLPQTETATLPSRLDLLLAQVLVGAADTRVRSASPAATTQVLKAESAVGEIRRQHAGVTEGSDEQRVLCARALAAKARLEAANAYAEAAAQAGQAKKSRERTIAEWKSILAEHARAVIALSEAQTVARD